MIGDRGFRIASANVHYAEFDGEVVVINTLIGSYYSLRGSAIDIWSLIEANASRQMIVESLAARYDGDREAIAAAVDRCLAQLVEHALIGEAPANNGSLTSVQRNGPKQALPEPLIESVDDLRDLLVLDPVHDVSEAGWPQRGPDPAE